MRLFEVEEGHWEDLDSVVTVMQSEKYFVLTMADGHRVDMQIDDPKVKKIKATLKLK